MGIPTRIQTLLSVRPFTPLPFHLRARVSITARFHGRKSMFGPVFASPKVSGPPSHRAVRAFAGCRRLAEWRAGQGSGADGEMAVGEVSGHAESAEDEPEHQPPLSPPLLRWVTPSSRPSPIPASHLLDHPPPRQGPPRPLSIIHADCALPRSPPGPTPPSPPDLHERVAQGVFGMPLGSFESTLPNASRYPFASRPPVSTPANDPKFPLPTPNPQSLPPHPTGHG